MRTPCDFCNRVFYSEEEYGHHLSVIHKEELESDLR